MPTLTPNRFELDLTGTSVDNHVLGELHSPAVRDVRSIAPTYGPFYTEGLVVKDIATNATLTRGVHYYCTDVVGLPTAQTGKEICAIILLTNRAIATVSIDYHAIGGQYERQYESIRMLMDALSSDTRPSNWNNLQGRPSTFDPVMHLHAAGDIYGFEYLVSSLEQLKNSVLLGDELSHMEMFRQIQVCNTLLNSLITEGTPTTAADILAVANATTTLVSTALNKVNELDAKYNTLMENITTLLNSL